jgi:hypothetical protein
MTDNNDLLRAWTLIKRRERRERIAHDLAVVKAAERAGLPVKRAAIDGVDLEFGQPAPATPVNRTAVADSDINEWDRDLGTYPPEVRQ